MTALLLLRRLWPALLAGALIVVILIQSAALTRKDAKLQHLADVGRITVERINRGVAASHARDLAYARRIETAQANANQEASGEIDALRSRALALAADYARRLHNGAQAAGGGVSAAGDGGPAGPAGAAAGAGGVSELDDADLRICTENTVKALGWRAWWKRISEIPR